MGNALNMMLANRDPSMNELLNMLAEGQAGVNPGQPQVNPLSLLPAGDPAPRFGLPQSGVNALSGEKYPWIKSIIQGVGDFIGSNQRELVKGGRIDEEALQDLVMDMSTPLGMVKKGAALVGIGGKKAAGFVTKDGGKVLLSGKGSDILPDVTGKGGKADIPAGKTPKAEGGVNSGDIIYAPRKGKRELVIENGKAVLYADPVYERDIAALRRTFFRDVDNLLSPLEEGEYVRVTNNPKDFEYLQNGSHRGSLNRNVQEWESPVDEGGLSVGKRPEIPAKYAYYVRGKEIGQGADGEPLLDVSTAKPSSSLMSYDELSKDFNSRKSDKIKTLGLTEKDIGNLYNGRVVKSDLPNPTRPPESGGRLRSQ